MLGLKWAAELFGGGCSNRNSTSPRVRPKKQMSSSRATRQIFLFYTLTCILALAGGCRRNSQPSIPPSLVTVGHPISQPVTENLDLTGTVAASHSVNLVARVAGYLESVNFKDGDYVEKDQLLFVIEPAPYEEQVALNEATLVQAQAEYDRQQALSQQNATAASR